MKNTYYPRLIQILEIKTEFNKSNIDVPKIIKLFKELFEDLSVETTTLSCMEIDQLCTDLVVTDKIKILPEYAQDYIEECMTLHDFPSKWSITPLELLNVFKEMYDMYDGIESIISVKDQILILYKEGKKIEEISKELGVDKNIVDRQIIIARKLNQI